jgi:amino acid transporter
MNTEQRHLINQHKLEYVTFVALISVFTIICGLALYWVAEATVHFLLYFPVYLSTYIASIFYANKYGIQPLEWRNDMVVLLTLIGVCVACMMIVYVAHKEVGTIYISALFQLIFGYLAFTSAQWQVNKREAKVMKAKIKKEMKGR